MLSVFFINQSLDPELSVTAQEGFQSKKMTQPHFDTKKEERPKWLIPAVIFGVIAFIIIIVVVPIVLLLSADTKSAVNGDSY